MDIVDLLRRDVTTVRRPDGTLDFVSHAAADEIERLREALRAFIKQWNACGPNSDFGRHFANVRKQAVVALGEEK